MFKKDKEWEFEPFEIDFCESYIEHYNDIVSALKKNIHETNCKNSRWYYKLQLKTEKRNLKLWKHNLMIAENYYKK